MGSSYINNVRTAYGNAVAALCRGTFDEAWDSVNLLRREVKSLEKHYESVGVSSAQDTERALWAELTEATDLQKRALHRMAQRGDSFHKMHATA